MPLPLISSYPFLYQLVSTIPLYSASTPPWFHSCRKPSFCRLPKRGQASYAEGPASLIGSRHKAERDVDEVDLLIVGGGPAGLSAAIRFQQLAQKDGKELRVMVVEKAGEIGKVISVASTFGIIVVPVLLLFQHLGSLRSYFHI